MPSCLEIRDLSLRSYTRQTEQVVQSINQCDWLKDLHMNRDLQEKYLRSSFLIIRDANLWLMPPVRKTQKFASSFSTQPHDIFSYIGLLSKFSYETRLSFHYLLSKAKHFAMGWRCTANRSCMYDPGAPLNSSCCISISAKWRIFV